MTTPDPIAPTLRGVSPLDRWLPGDRVTVPRLNELVDAINAIVSEARFPEAVIPQKKITAGFWAEIIEAPDDPENPGQTLPPATGSAYWISEVVPLAQGVLTGTVTWGTKSGGRVVVAENVTEARCAGHMLQLETVVYVHELSAADGEPVYVFNQAVGFSTYEAV